MTDRIDLKPVLEFLDDLKDHNNKAWFEAHRAAYETAKENFEAFVDRLIDDFGSVEDLRSVDVARYLWARLAAARLTNFAHLQTTGKLLCSFSLYACIVLPLKYIIIGD